MSRMLEIATSAGADVFLVQSFSGREELGRLYEYRLELLAERADITAEMLLGTNATVSLEMMDPTAKRFFNGYVTSFSVVGLVTTPAFKGNTGYVYSMTLSPGLWFLTRSSNSQIFSQMAINDVIMQVLGKDPLMTTSTTVATTETRDYIVQYRETDFNFVSRLAEHAGIYYYFTHKNGTHEMVLLDQVGKHQPIDGLPTLTSIGDDGLGTLMAMWMVSEVQSGAFSTGDYNYVTPNTQIAAVTSNPKSHSNAGFEMFDHPVDTTTSTWAATYAQIRADELACRYAIVHGSATERSLQVGFKTTVANHAIDALNQEYVIIGHSFEAKNNLASTASGDGASWMCTFEAIPSGTQFRAMRTVARPVIAGTQTALVVSDFHNDTDTSSDGGDPIGANMGRVKVEFYWDRYGKQSCWARVSTPWAGKGYGFQNMPRVGEEVLVQFIEGDPDRPVVIGRVYNAQNMPPYVLPKSSTITGLKTLSVDSSGASVAGKWNELRFDDNSGSEQIYVQAQKDFDRRVLNDSKTWIGNESHNYVKADTFDKFDADHHVQTTGDHNEKIGGSLSFNVTSDTHLKAGSNILTEAGQEIHLKGGMKVVIEGGTELTLKVGGNFIDINPGGVFIKGTMVMVNSGGSAGTGTAASPIAPKDGKTAMTSDGGSPITAPTPPTAPTAFSPQASSFQLAAVTGAPFVAPCNG